MWSEGLVVEEFTPGEEYAVQVLISSGDYVILPMVWEYQRLYDGGRGPNTGGMGAVAPIRIDDRLFELIKDLVGRTVKAMLKESLAYEGFLYLGVMASPDGVRVLEYNVRLGDPETEAIVPLDMGGFVRMIKDTAFGRLPEKIQPSGISVALSLVSDGAPYHYTESVIDLPDDINDIYFDHVKEKDSKLYVSGWRPCVVVGSGATYEEAVKKAYKRAEEVRFEGQFYRGDVGKSLL
jgi:phosphoribosylamine--glycine ligase